MPANRSPKKLLKPPALRPGARIGIVAPSSPVERGLFAAGCDELRRMGYEPVYSEEIFSRDLYFAGSAERRLRELHAMFECADIEAIVCARGGYGSNYLLPQLDRGLIRKSPKIFIGYSDATVLLAWLQDHAGLVCFHGPMLAKDFAHPGNVDRASWNAALSGAQNWSVSAHDAEALVRGQARGVLYGGCLSLLSASLGTPYEIETGGKILFIEDVAAKPYQIDRMLMQLKSAGKFDRVRGLIFGEMLECKQPGGQDYPLQEVIRRIVGETIPVAYGVRSGHVSGENITLPFGVTAELKVDEEVEFKIVEAATLPAVSARAARRGAR